MRFVGQQSYPRVIGDRGEPELVRRALVKGNQKSQWQDDR